MSDYCERVRQECLAEQVCRLVECSPVSISTVQIDTPRAALFLPDYFDDVCINEPQQPGTVRFFILLIIIHILNLCLFIRWNMV